MKYIKKWDGKEAIKKRIQGAIGGFYKIGADNKIRILVDIGAVTYKQQQAWKKLRNTNVHEYQTNKLNNDEFLKLIFEVNVLLYHLIFHAIGYEGPYMDVSVLDFPIKQYPL